MTKAESGGAHESIAPSSSPLKELRFDYNFYVSSYSDLVNLNEAQARAHFAEYGMKELRYCSSYHFFKCNLPGYEETLVIEKHRANNFAATRVTPLDICNSILSDLTIGVPTKRDLEFLKSPSLRSQIAKHGSIVEWTSRFNSPEFRVLEIGSRNVASNAVWKKYMPQATYTGLDIIEGDNVDIVGDAHSLSDLFPSETFDLVISLAVFEHLAMPWVAAEEISKVLKVGGFCAVETHFSFSEHELPWHFFQFNAHALAALFNEQLGFKILDYGLDNPIIGRFADSACSYLRGKPVTDLYCHSSIIAQKTSTSDYSSFNWRQALPGVINTTMYPRNTGLSSDWKA